MKKSASYRFLVFITTALLLMGVLSCENTDKDIAVWTTNKVMTEEATMVESYVSQDGKMKAKLTAPSMIRIMGRVGTNGNSGDSMQTNFPKSLHCVFYDDSSNVESWVDSKQGIYYQSLNKVYLWDSVVVINVGGDTLKAADLWWDQNTRMFYTEKYAEYLRRDRQIFPSKGLSATQDFSSVVFNFPTGRLQVKEDGFPK